MSSERTEAEDDHHMTDELTYPGVYIEEIPSGVRTIMVASTSVAVFVGPLDPGPFPSTKVCHRFGDFEREFYTMDQMMEMVTSVRLFFANGGTECHVVRIFSGEEDEYRRAFELVERDVDTFNLLVLPRHPEHDIATLKGIWQEASRLSMSKRAMLLLDAPSEWQGPDDALDPHTGIAKLGEGLARDHCAIFFPRLIVHDGDQTVSVGPSGAIAGLMARIDGTRGVWKAPAGTEADIRGIEGLTNLLSDDQSGELNRLGVNVIRAFDTGIVNWGARTMDGADDMTSEWKYIPVRRLALYIEESLYRGTQWIVLEPNDEPLWAQIRMNVGAFMHGLFRQGAFQGTSPKDAYFVKCDSETTTQADMDGGVVNILVGFAPLKPAEFVVIKISQMAGSLQT
jgi:phage tail sheath protein FI